MNRRIVSGLFALSMLLSPALAGCGSSDDADSKAATPTLSGVYRPLQAGAIASITFTGREDYLLMPSGCGGGACAEIGTFTLDSDRNVLVLESAATHRKRSIALEILETTGGGGADQGSLVKSVAPLDLVTPGQQTTTGGGQQLATSGNATTGEASQLIALIKQLLMDDQKMKQDDQNGGGNMGGGGNMAGGNMGGGGIPMLPMLPMNPGGNANGNANANPMPAMNDPKVDCKKGIPTKDTPLADVAAYFAKCPAGP